MIYSWLTPCLCGVSRILALREGVMRLCEVSVKFDIYFSANFLVIKNSLIKFVIGRNEMTKQSSLRALWIVASYALAMTQLC